MIYLLLAVSLLAATYRASAQTDDWTHFRGSKLNGIAETDRIPVKWDDSSIKWKTAIHGRGHSSPVVYGDQIWLTTATTDGKELFAVCVDYRTGRIIHDIKVFTPEQTERKHGLNTYATPTPCIEKEFVYVHYGSSGTACINTSDGKVVWKRNDLKCRHVQGAASSPVIYRNLLILHFEGTDVRYIAALDKSSGELVWRHDRPAEPYEALAEIGRKAYVTPLIINVKGRDMLISNGSAVCQAIDPVSGREIWRINGGAESTVSMPFSENGIVYWYAGPHLSSNGLSYNELFAANADGTGDVTLTKVIWKKQARQSQNHMLTPVIRDGLIYTADTRNLMSCIDAATGEEVWSTRVTSNCNASPLYIDGNVWFFTVKGGVLVIKPGRKYELAAQNQLDSGIWATPAVVRNSMVIRTEEYLYRIE